MSTKFSQFTGPSALQAGDVVVGLRGGVNSQFLASSIAVTPYVSTAISLNMTPNTGYVATNAVPITLTLPAIVAFGSVFEIINAGTSTVTIGQLAGQQIKIGGVGSTIGIGGSVSCTAGGSIILICITANTTFQNLGGPQNVWTIT